MEAILPLPQCVNIILANTTADNPHMMGKPDIVCYNTAHDGEPDIISYNMACHPGGHYWDYWAVTLSFSQVTATHLKIDLFRKINTLGHVPSTFRFPVLMCTILDELREILNSSTK